MRRFAVRYTGGVPTFAPGLEDSLTDNTVFMDSLTAAAFTAKERGKFAKSGVALPDGSFPIRNEGDLHNAVSLLGKAKDKAAAKAHIVRRARALGLTDKLPESWGKDSEPDSDADDVTAAGWDESKHPRASRGQKGGGRWIVETRQGGKIVVEAGSEMEAIARASDAVNAGEYGRSTKEQQGADLEAGRATAEPVEEMVVSPSDDERDSFDAGYAEARDALDSGVSAEELAADIDDSDPDRAYTDGMREAIANAREVPPDSLAQAARANREFQARSSERAFDRSVPLATDTPTRPGQVVQTRLEDMSMDQLSDVVAKAKDSPFSTAHQERAVRAARILAERSGMTASAAGMVPVHPPAEWFDDPGLPGLTPLTVTADGQVYGHLAPWGQCHIANPRGAGVCVEAPQSATGYGFFHLGQVEAEDGRMVACGQITMDAGHASMGATARGAASHYDHTGTAAADVRCGEDRFGIWVAGALRPTLTASSARTLMGAKLSGDWRGIGGNLELVGILAVNVPGFPVPRPAVSLAASAVGDPRVALVAAGIVGEVDDETMRRKVRILAARASGGLEALGLVAAGFDESKIKRQPATGKDGKESPEDGGKFASKSGGKSSAKGEEKPKDGEPSGVKHKIVDGKIVFEKNAQGLVDMSDDELAALHEQLANTPGADPQHVKLVENVIKGRHAGGSGAAMVKNGKLALPGKLALVDLTDEELTDIEKKLSSSKDANPQEVKLVQGVLKIRKQAQA